MAGRNAKDHEKLRRIVSLCISCNRPAPEFDAYEDLTAHMLSLIEAGVTIIRHISTGTSGQKQNAIGTAHEWVQEAAQLIGEATDYREAVGSATSVHTDCDAWKVTHRRINGIASNVDFMRRDLIGHFVPGFKA